MFYITNRDYATLIMDSGTLLLMIGIIYLTSRNRKKGRTDESCFFILLILNIIIAAGDMLAYTTEEKVFPGSYVMATAGMTVFYVGFALISMAWLHYCRVRFKDGGLPDRSHFSYEYLPGLITVGLVLINVFTGWIFSYDSEVMYHRGVLFIPMYIVMAAYIVAGFFYVSRYRDKSSGRVLIPTWVYAFPLIFGVIFTFMVSGSASFAPICIAISITFTYMGTINETSR